MFPCDLSNNALGERKAGNEKRINKGKGGLFKQPKMKHEKKTTLGGRI